MLHPSAAWLRLAPTPLHERLLALTVNQLLRGQSITERLSELCGKRFCLRADDVPIALTFEITAHGLARSTLALDVTLSGTLADFIALALRIEDPDTLFFQRRLAVEGETETGLHLKNLLDAWEYDVPAHVNDVLPAPLARTALALRSGARVLSQIVRLRPPGSRRNNRREARFRETGTGPAPRAHP